MDKQIILSIIVPIYNVENYLERCLDSVVNQINNQIEIILVNDGSTDSSLLICDKYLKYKNVKLINKENGGLSDARNQGILESSGEYILFLDSDDSLVSGACNKILSFIEQYKTDILFFDIIRKNMNNSVLIGKRGFNIGEVLKGFDALKLELKTGSFTAMAQTAICNKKFIVNNNLFFEKGIYHEDEEWMPRAMIAANNIVRLEYAFYNYYIRGGSITQTINNKRYYDYIHIADKLKKLYSSYDDEFIKYAYSYLAKIYMNAVTHLKNNKIKKINVEYDFIRKHNKGLKNKIKFIIFKFFPRIYCKIISR